MNPIHSPSLAQPFWSHLDIPTFPNADAHNSSAKTCFPHTHSSLDILSLSGPEVIEHATFLYDVIERRNGRHRRSLALWLAGYEVPFEPLLRHWLHAIDTILKGLTGGAHDEENALFHLSSVLTQHIEPKWPFSPRPDTDLHQVAHRHLLSFPRNREA